MKIRTLAASVAATGLLAGMISASHAAVLTPTSYVYNASGATRYSPYTDSGLTVLTNGVIGGTSISSEYVVWFQNANPTGIVDFTFAAPVNPGVVVFDYLDQSSVGYDRPTSLTVKLYSDPGFTTLVSSYSHTNTLSSARYTPGQTMKGKVFVSGSAQYVRVEATHAVNRLTDLSEVTFLSDQPGTVHYYYDNSGSYTLPPSSGTIPGGYSDYFLTKLTDGVTSGTPRTDNYIYTNAGGLQTRIYYDLGAALDLESLGVYYYVDTGGIKCFAPASLTIDLFSDPAFTTQVGTLTESSFPSVNLADNLKTIDLTGYSAQYARLTFTNHASGGMLLAETAFTGSAAVIPEPASAMLLALGAGLLLKRRARG